VSEEQKEIKGTKQTQTTKDSDIQRIMKGSRKIRNMTKIYKEISKIVMF
jgi:hypothetical protein